MDGINTPPRSPLDTATETTVAWLQTHKMTPTPEQATQFFLAMFKAAYKAVNHDNDRSIQALVKLDNLSG
ncbi:MAG: hypothetical protein ACREOO_15030 [bacterium]